MGISATRIEHRGEFHDVLVEELVIDEVVSDDDGQQCGPHRRRRCRDVPPDASSAISAVLVRLGSMTIIDRSGSLAISLRTLRASGNPWLFQGFLPRKMVTSECSMSARVWARYSRASTKASPVFS